MFGSHLSYSSIALSKYHDQTDLEKEVFKTGLMASEGQSPWRQSKDMTTGTAESSHPDPCIGGREHTGNVQVF